MNTIIDAKDLILGRLSAIVAKRALNGDKIDIVNSEKAIITGRKEFILKKYKERRKRGHPFKGPFFPTMPDRILRRVIRGMLPYKQEKGRKAFKNIMCHIGIPKNIEHSKLETIKNAHLLKSKTINFITLGELCKSLRK